MTPVEAWARIEQLLNDANTASTTKVDVFIDEPKVRTDSDGKAHAYIVLFPGAGVLDPADASLCGTHGSRALTFQATCAGGDTTRLLRAVTRLQSALVGQRLNDTTGLIREAGGPDQILWDRDIKPDRAYLPVLLTVELGETPPAP